MKRLQEKLEFLLDKYQVEKSVTLKSGKIAEIDGKEISLFPHRSERRLLELKNIVNGGTLVGVSVMRVMHTVEKGTDVYEVLERELDVIEYVLQRKVTSVMAVQNQNTLNVIATCEGGVVCTVEIAATLKAGDEEKDKHEIISQRGIACDVVVDAQLRQDSIYLFGEETQKYTDVDFELYGLNPSEVAVVRSAFQLAQEKSVSEREERQKSLCRLVEMAKRSAASGVREVL